jgi:ABC-type glycerol-3-phosphate transport system permease component
VSSVSPALPTVGSPAKRKQRSARHIVRSAILLGIMLLVSAIFLLPLIWMISTSLKTNAEAYTWPPILIPSTLHWQNYPEAWNYEGTQFPRWTLNTIFITVMVMIGVLISSTLCAYGFARIRFPGRNFWFIFTIATIMLPPQVTLIPLYIGFFRIGWLDTFNPLIIPAWFGGGALNIFLLRQFFMGIPSELEDAAHIDGANRLQILLRIFIPLSMPGILTVAIFTFQGVWNDFYGPLIYLRSMDKFTLALGINQFNGLYGQTQMQYMMAVSFLMTIPMIVVFFVAQRYFIRGIVLTGVNR